MKRILFVTLLFVISVTFLAQLPTPNLAGASAGHHIFRVKDVEVANKFWTTLGGEPARWQTSS